MVFDGKSQNQERPQEGHYQPIQHQAAHAQTARGGKDYGETHCMGKEGRHQEKADSDLKRPA